MVKVVIFSLSIRSSKKNKLCLQGRAAGRCQLTTSLGFLCPEHSPAGIHRVSSLPSFSSLLNCPLIRKVFLDHISLKAMLAFPSPLPYLLVAFLFFFFFSMYLFVHSTYYHHKQVHFPSSLSLTYAQRAEAGFCSILYLQHTWHQVGIR